MSFTMGFTTGARGGQRALTVPYYGYEIIETAGLASRILTHEHNSPGSLGIVPGSRFYLYSNTGCPQAGGYNELASCYNGISSNGQADIYYGTQSGGMQTGGAWWKFIVAHEIGHAVQDIAMGAPGATSDYDLIIDGNHYACRCDNVSTAQQHCLNSVEIWYVASYEGFAQFFGDKLFNIDTQPNATFVNY